MPQVPCYPEGNIGEERRVDVSKDEASDSNINEIEAAY